MKPRLVVYSDYICPFCYIGFDRVEKLKHQFDIEVDWRPFEVHPETPQEGIWVEDLGYDEGYLEMARMMVERLAEEAGLEIKLSEKMSNSRLALQTSEFAKAAGKFEAFHRLVFNEYWKHAIDIGSLEQVVALAKSVGLDIEALEQYLASENALKQLKSYLPGIKKHMVTGVPTFIIADKRVVGAQPYKVLKNVVEKALRE